jgi:hypothetical protein
VPVEVDEDVHLRRVHAPDARVSSSRPHALFSGVRSHAVAVEVDEEVDLRSASMPNASIRSLRPHALFSN